MGGGAGWGASGVSSTIVPAALSISSGDKAWEGPQPRSQQPTSTALHAPRAGKTRGMGAGRKLRLHRKEERWADKDYKKSNLGSEWKKPFAGASHAKGIVLEKM